MPKTAARSVKDSKVKSELDEDFKRDLKEIEATAKEIVDIFSRKAFSQPGMKIDADMASPIEFFVKLTDSVKESYAVSIVEIAALSHCIRAIAERYSGVVGEDIFVFQKNKRILVQVLNDSSRTIRKLRAGDAKTFKDILKIFEDSFGTAAVSKRDSLADGVHGLMMSNIDSLKSDKEKVNEAVQELIDMVLRIQLIIGILLKWSFVAEEKFISQIKGGVKDADLSRFYNEYLPPLLEQIGIIGKTFKRI